VTPRDDMALRAERERAPKLVAMVAQTLHSAAVAIGSAALLLGLASVLGTTLAHLGHALPLHELVLRPRLWAAIGAAAAGLLLLSARERDPHTAEAPEVEARLGRELERVHRPAGASYESA